MRQELRQLGLRATASRLAVLVELHEREAPVTHEELMDALGQGNYDRATIYRILSDLTDAGLLRRMDLGDHVWRYELLDACRKVEDDHAHFLCEGCGAVSCLPPLELRVLEGRLPAMLQGAEIHVKVTGRCAACAA
jgi:Fur family ferric uptake transcriptional regulator